MIDISTTLLRVIKALDGLACFTLFSLEGHKHGGRNVTETSVTEFCY